MALIAAQANLAAEVAEQALTIAEPIAIKFGDLLGKYKEVLNQLYNPSKTEESINILTNEARNQIVQEATKNIKNVQTEADAEQIILETKQKLEALNNQVGGQRYIGQRYIGQRYIGQRGGKKILSRTNKSIAQFLNSKVTFQSILKRMTSKYKMGGKRGTRRRLHKR